MCRALYGAVINLGSQMMFFCSRSRFCVALALVADRRLRLRLRPKVEEFSPSLLSVLASPGGCIDAEWAHPRDNSMHNANDVAPWQHLHPTCRLERLAVARRSTVQRLGGLWSHGRTAAGRPTCQIGGRRYLRACEELWRRPWPSTARYFDGARMPGGVCALNSLP